MCEKRLCPAPAGQDGVGFPHTERTLAARLRGLLALALCLCLTLALLPAPAQAAETPATSWENYADIDWYMKDEGADSYDISTAAELAGLAKLVNSGRDFLNRTVTLTADVDLSAHVWVPIGVTPYAFDGTFHGGGNTVTGLILRKASISFFGDVSATGKVDGLNIKDASGITDPQYSLTSAGLLARSVNSGGMIYNCTVSGSLEIENRCGADCYVGGLVGNNEGTIKNCSVHLASVTGSSFLMQFGGVAGSGAVENCFAIVDSDSLEVTYEPKKYNLAPTARYSYWGSTSAVTDTNSEGYTECYPVQPDQIAGTGSANIGNGTYSQTTSLVAALDNWVAAQNDKAYSIWAINRSGDAVPKLFIPTYIDVSGPLNDVTHQSATGDIETGMDLEGQVQENVTLLSVTLPASIPFIVDVETDGAFKRVLSATGTLANSSDCGVDITLTAVTDEGELLKKVALSLVPAPAPSADTAQIALAEGAGKTDLLAALAAPAEDGTPTTATLKVDGAAKTGVDSIGNDGDAFVVGLTLKVSKQ